MRNFLVAVTAGLTAAFSLDELRSQKSLAENQLMLTKAAIGLTEELDLENPVVVVDLDTQQSSGEI